MPPFEYVRQSSDEKLEEASFHGEESDNPARFSAVFGGGGRHGDEELRPD